MQISIDQLTTIVSTAALGDFEERKRRKTDLYFHIVLRMDGDLIEGEKLLLLKRYIAGYVRATGGAVQAIAAGGAGSRCSPGFPSGVLRRISSAP